MLRSIRYGIGILFAGLLLGCQADRPDEPTMAVQGMPMTANSEAAFLDLMIPHHEEAVRTAQEIQERSEREEMRSLATSIIEGQTREIEQMETWLREWHEGAERTSEYRGMMPDLEGLPPDELDRVFLEGMSMHHMMAIRMAQHLQMGDRIEHEEVANLTDAIIESQSEEVEQMSQWLADWYNVELPMMAMRGDMPMHEHMHEMHGGTGTGQMMDRMHDQMRGRMHERTREHMDRMREQMHPRMQGNAPTPDGDRRSSQN